MKKKLTAILLVLTLCLWYAPAGIWNSAAQAGTPTWTGGDSGCKHESFHGQCQYQDENYHIYLLTCSDCGAKGRLPGESPEAHNWQTSEITPGGPDYPYGGTIKYCDK